MPKKGYKQTEEHRRKCADLRKGKKQSKEHIRKRVSSYKGKKLSKDHIQKLIIARNKRPLLSEETKRKIGKSISGKNNGMWKGGDITYCHKKAWELFGNDYCENCYMTNKDHKQKWKKRLEMHNTLDPKDYKIMESEAWMTLCRTCHRGLEVALENERNWIKNYTRFKIKLIL